MTSATTTNPAATNAGPPGVPRGISVQGSLLDTSTTVYALHAVLPDGTSGLVPFDGLAWEELTGELATRITVTLPETDLPNGQHLSELVTLGTPLNVLAAIGNGSIFAEVARGIVEEVQPNDGAGGTFQVIAYDPIRALLTNKDDLFYEDGQTPGAMIHDIADRWKIQLGTIDPLVESVTLPVQIIHGQTLADLIISWLQQAYDLGCDRLVPRSTNGELEIVRAGTNTTVYWLMQGESTLRHPERLSTMDLINRVVVLGRGTTTEAAPVVATMDATGTADPATYGVRQDMIHMSARKTVAQIRVAALTILNEKSRPRHDRTLEAPDVPMMRKFDRVRVTGGTMDGYFSVESVTHNAEPDATMRLALGNLHLMTVDGIFTMIDENAIPDGGPDQNPVDVSIGVNDARLYALAIGAGWTGNDAITAVAISIAEDRSSDPTVLSAPNSDGSRDLGLWQINGGKDGVLWAQYGGQGALVDPATNAAAAFGLWKARGFQPWSTFNDGSYKGFLNRAIAAAAAPAESAAEAPAATPAGLDHLMALIRPWLGSRYVYGGNVIGGVDCSGFTLAIYKQLGAKMSARTAQTQFNATQRTTNPQPGDLVFFSHTYDDGPDNPITHVGIYVGNNQMASAIEPQLVIQSLSMPFYQAHFAGYGHLPGLTI